MKITLLLFVALCLAVSLGSARRMGKGRKHVLINRPNMGVLGSREKRTAWSGVKGGRPAPAPPVNLELGVRKGEYVCGNKICKLEPGVVPKGCNGICQYPV